MRRALTDMGIRYRTCVRSLAGRPDLANQRHKWAIFVHGCFWHGHDGCRYFTRPKTNAKFWRDKVLANQGRDRRNELALRQDGFRVLTVWQCETMRHESLLQCLLTFLRCAGDRHGRAAD